jgi:toxin ParE1/3/4
MTRISFHRLAERELNDAALYYEGESPGLGVIFLDEIERFIEAIAKNPSGGIKVRGRVQRRILRRFPYGILYSAKAEGNLRWLTCMMSGISTYDWLTRRFPVGPTTK